MPESEPKTKIAIACQGGGTQTAFTAGALRRILTDPGLDRDFEIVALSGTSGGAVCSVMAWYGLIAHADEPEKRGQHAADLIFDFWEANSAHDPLDLYVTNPTIVALHRLVDAGLMPAYPPPPGLPGQVYGRLRSLIETLVPFDSLPGLLRAAPNHPTLLCGAVDVLSGEFAVFEEACPDPAWHRNVATDAPAEVSVDTILASAAVPPLMPAVSVGKGPFWDGLFAHNPPIRSIVECDASMRPDEIWVLQIDPEKASKIPVSPTAVVDRRFELSSNLSMNGELHWIRQINQWIDQGVLPAESFKTIDVARVPISQALGDSLDLASKVDRNPAFLRQLMADGEAQVNAFLASRGDPDSPWYERRYPRGHQALSAPPGVA